MALMYFGTQEHMSWVKCPASGMGRNAARYTSEGVFLNGGSYVRSSAASHNVYEMNWNFLRQVEKEAIRDYYDGIYGTGLIHFLDPFAMTRNVLPSAWSNPGLALVDGVSLLDVRPKVGSVVLSGEGSVTNLYTNPSFEDGIAGLLFSSDLTLSHSTSGGSFAFVGGGSALCEVSATPSPRTFLYQHNVDALGGNFVASSFQVRPSGGPYPFVARTVFYDDADVIISYGPFGSVVNAVNAQWSEVRAGLVAAPVGTASARTYLYQGDGVGDIDATPGAIFFTDAWLTAVTDSESEALAVLDAGYFDGNTQDTQSTVYSWTGPEHGSASVKSPSYAVSGLPNRGAKYTLTDTSVPKTLWVPVPDGYTLHVGAVHSKTGTAALTVSKDAGGTVTVPADTSGAQHVIPATAVTDCGGGVTLNLTGVGTITLQAIMAQVLPDGQSPSGTRFISGQGNSGCRFSGDFTETGYSAPQALDFSALSFTLRETGSWE